jgi:hypothetical protein
MGAERWKIETAGLGHAFDSYNLRVARNWLLAGKSSIAELPLNLTWSIYAFLGSFAALRMTARFKGRISIRETEAPSETVLR